MDEPNNVNNSMVLDFEIEDNNFKFASNSKTIAFM